MELQQLYLQVNERYSSRLILHRDNTFVGSVAKYTEELALKKDVLYFLSSDATALFYPSLVKKEINLLAFEADIDLANSGIANVILILDHCDEYSVFHMIEDTIREDYRLLLFGKKLFQMFLKGASLQSIIDTAFSFLENPIAVIDAGFSRLASTSGPDVDDSSEEWIFNEKHISRRAMEILNIDHIHRRVLNCPNAVVFSHPSQPYRRIIIRINTGDKNIGHIVMRESNHPFSAQDCKYIECLRDVVKQWLLNDSFTRNSRGQYYEYLLADLLSGLLNVDENNLNSISDNLKISPHELIYIAAVELSRSTTFVSVVHTRDMLEQLLPNSRSIIYNGQIVLITSRTATRKISPDEIKKLRIYCQENDLFCGMSNSFLDVSYIRNYYQQALHALEFGASESGSPSLYLYQDFALTHVEQIFSKHESQNVFCHPAIKRLIQNDAENSSKLAETLYCFLLYERNKSITAEKLCVNRRTLNKRLEKIFAIADVDLDDYNIRNYLLVSLKYLKGSIQF